MRHFLIPVLLLGLIAGCSSVKISPHRIDVQQGNALDQENVARLKPGLSRSQVRFLLGTPLVVDPFRTDRWDYVYVYYKAGKLAEQKRITLFFDGDTLARIEGDVPDTVPTEAPIAPATEAAPIPAREERASPSEAPAQVAASAAQAAATPPVATTPVVPAATQAAPAPAATRVAPSAQTARAATVASDVGSTSVVAPLPSPKNAPPYTDPRAPAELSLSPETDVSRIQPDVMPSFPDPNQPTDTSASDDPVLTAVRAWAAAWARHDEAAYFSAYDASFVPPGGDSRAAWEARRRLLLDVAKNVDVKVDAPVVQRMPEGDAVVTFNQLYRSDSYRDAVVKQLRLIEREGRWLIVEERVMSTLRGKQP